VHALEERQLKAVARPEIVAEEVRPAEGLRYSATIEIKPDVRVEATIDSRSSGGRAGGRRSRRAQLERLRNRSRRWCRSTDRDSVEQGDLVVAVVHGGRRRTRAHRARPQSRVVEVGSGTFPPPFEEKLVGMKRGESAHIPVEYPRAPSQRGRRG
jgi:trigger factor